MGVGKSTFLTSITDNKQIKCGGGSGAVTTVCTQYDYLNTKIIDTPGLDDERKQTTYFIYGLICKYLLE